MTVSERLRSCWSPSRLACAHQGDLPSSHWGKPQKLNRSHFEWTTKSLLWYPYRCVDQKATSVTAAEFYGAVISSNLYVPANSAVVHSWNTRFEQFFYHLSFKKSCVFLWFSIQPDFSEHFSLKFWLILGVKTCEAHEWRKTKTTKHYKQ